ncbi:MAG: hydroxymethylglutaryl-CoA lyase [Phycisphaerae bacterium]
MTEVTLCEMSPRDGLQFLGAHADTPRMVPLEQKLALVAALQDAHLPYIEVGAYVSPKATPQMADTDELARRIEPRVGVQLAALVPNLKHYERLRGGRCDTVALFVSASEGYSQKNMGVSLEQALKWAREVANAATADGRRLRAHVSGAFQDVFSGDDADIASVVEVVKELRAMRCACVALADTNGQTHPRRIREVIRAVGDAVSLGAIAVHLHDRAGQGIVNAFAAFEAGVRTFDASVGGLGGSTKALGGKASGGATAGNVATEELVELFEREGVRTGVDRGALGRAGEIIHEITELTGDGAPPSRALREMLHYGLRWQR